MSVPLEFGQYWQSPQFSDMTVHIVEDNEQEHPRPSSASDDGSARPAKVPCTHSSLSPSDTIRLQQQQQQQQHGTIDEPPAAKYVIPAHRFCLAAGSGYFSTRLVSDFHENDIFMLKVAPGEADAAHAVLQSLYTGSLPAEKASAAELVVLYKVADRLQARCISALVNALVLLTMADWDWDAAMLVSPSP
jgi:hypothetical protein